uniref:NADH dehydrogenase subunit 4L n=1 Tax=Auricularia delicata TaxID=160860 RepID=UPI00207A6E3D|nr:NADH dehydrogenase subunit 4L [Auricularia delicata]YP_010574184.1 NADH dehydrogenase subunit 4L [Auricularia cornea]URP31157.1 NADH dehydrogenase subunit 4L [Auricularia delicata]UZH94029.1 NADH dehydrogenase subunit 4L [Auricularia cornea]
MSSKVKELININIVTARSIISMLMIIRIIFLRFKINPNIPIKNKNKAKFI